MLLTHSLVIDISDSYLVVFPISIPQAVQQTLMKK